MEQSKEGLNQGIGFDQTHWTTVLAASGEDSPTAIEALNKLCRTYWFPLYAFIRRRRHDAHQAQDLTQDFFAHLLHQEALKDVSPEKGKFRTFLLRCLENFLHNQHQRQQTLKRGKDFEIVSWDAEDAEKMYRNDSDAVKNPHLSFDNDWAVAVVRTVMKRLKQDYHDKGKELIFKQLRCYLNNSEESVSYAEASAALGISEGAVKVAVHRLRRRFGEILKFEIANTVSKPEDINEEIRHLFSTIGE